METIKTINYVQESDRTIIITKEDNVIVGINYVQGSEIDVNRPIDQPLTDYVLDKIECESIEQIDHFIWQYVNKEQFFCGAMHRIEQSINEMIQDNCESGDISPSQSIKLEEYTNKLAEIVAEIVVKNQ